MTIESFGNIKFNELIIDTELFNGIQSVPHVTKETFYRLLLPSILPSDINRIMYLDPDIIIQGDIGKIYYTNMSEKSLIAASVSKDNDRWDTIKRRIKMPLSATYFNAGVCIMNLERLRNDEHFNPSFVMSFMKENYRYLIEGDQAYLNKFLWDKTIIINCLKYNLDTRKNIYYAEKWQDRILFFLQDIKNSVVGGKNAIIIHYRGKEKPWSKDYNGILKRKYMKYESEMRNNE